MEAINLTKQTINLTKKQSINLSKNTTKLSTVRVGLGWDPVKRTVFDYVMGMLGIGRPVLEYDLDAYVIVLSETKSTEVVYFNRLQWAVGRDICIQHHGDNLTGHGKQLDKEQITIDLSAIPAEYNELIVAVTIYKGYEKGQSFDDIHNTFIRVVDTKENFEICRYQEESMSSMPGAKTFIAGSFIRDNGDWVFKAIGEPTMESKISEVVARMDS